MDECRKRDPIPRFRKYLLDQEGVREEQLEDIEAQVRKLIEEAIHFVQESPKLRPESAAEDLYA